MSDNHIEVIKVAADRYIQFEKMIGKMNRKATKYGLKPLKAHRVNAYYENVQLVNGAAVAVEVYEYCVANPIPKINGWTLAARYHNEEGDGNLVFNRFVDTIPTQYMEELDIHNCDHCHTRRQRKSGFVLINDETGELIQLGRTCVRDYLGSVDATLFEKWFGLHNNFGEWFNREETYQYFLNVRDVLAVALTDARNRGYISKAKEQETRIVATASMVFMTLVTNNGINIASEDLQEAAKEVPAILNHFSKMRESGEHTSSDWMMNVNTLIQKNKISIKNIGILSSAIVKYLSDTAVKNPVDNTKYVGEIGERTDFTLTIENIWSNAAAEYATYFSCIYFCRDQDGNRVNIKSSRSLNLKIGETVKVTGTIKQHNDNPKYGKSTLINRAKVQESVQ